MITSTLFEIFEGMDHISPFYFDRQAGLSLRYDNVPVVDPVIERHQVLQFLQASRIVSRSNELVSFSALIFSFSMLIDTSNHLSILQPVRQISLLQSAGGYTPRLFPKTESGVWLAICAMVIAGFCLFLGSSFQGGRD